MTTVAIDPEKSRLFQDLVEYTGLSPQLALRRCDYAAAELAVLWQQRKSVKKFYQGGDLYLFDLTKYQLVLEHHGLVRKMVEQLKRLGAQNILEFGGGIGEFSIFVAEQGFPVTYYDLEGDIKKYALWRFRKHGANVTVASQDPLSSWEWDVVNVMDVLEHLEDPTTIIDQLAQHSRYIFCNPEEVRYGIWYPQHISRFSLEPHFEKVEGYLWKNKHKS